MEKEFSRAVFSGNNYGMKSPLMKQVQKIRKAGFFFKRIFQRVAGFFEEGTSGVRRS
jgi:hypothetical protein